MLMNEFKLKRLLGLAYRSRALLLGEYSCFKEIDKRRGRLILLAEDISEKSKKKIIEKASTNNIDFYSLPFNKFELGQLFGKKLTVALIINNENFSSGIKSYL